MYKYLLKKKIFCILMELYIYIWIYKSYTIIQTGFTELLLYIYILTDRITLLIFLYITICLF